MAKERASRGQSSSTEKNGKCAPNPCVCKEGKGVRNFGCHHYDTCLDKAAKNMWSGFTCRECTLHHFQKDEEIPS